jgi:hypothetical protein
MEGCTQYFEHPRRHDRRPCESCTPCSKTTRPLPRGAPSVPARVTWSESLSAPKCSGCGFRTITCSVARVTSAGHSVMNPGFLTFRYRDKRQEYPTFGLFDPHMAYQVTRTFIEFLPYIFDYRKSFNSCIFRARQVRWPAERIHYDCHTGADRSKWKVGSWIPGQLAYYENCRSRQEQYEQQCQYFISRGIRPSIVWKLSPWLPGFRSKFRVLAMTSR